VVRGSPQTRLTRPLLAPLVAATLVLAAAGADQRVAARAAVGDCTPGANWGTVRGDLAGQVVAMVNQHRTSLGLPGLADSAALTASAVWKARHMAFYGYMDHNDPAPPVARSVGDRMAACGYTAGWGENIAYGQSSAASVMQSWLSSPGHKANIERSSFRAIGVGVAAAANGRLYWTQAFGTVASGGPPPSPPPSPPPPPTPRPTSPAPPPPTPPPPVAPASRMTPLTAPTPPATPARTPAPSAPVTTAAKVTPTSAAPLPLLEASRLLQWGGRPRAGHNFTARITVTEPGTHERVRAGRVTCGARVADRPVWVGIHRFKNGFVVCRWRIPHTAERHRIIGTIRVSAAGKRTARWFSRIVR
jgi:uncharacterized protein YkwD